MTKNGKILKVKKSYLRGEKFAIYLSRGLHEGRPNYRTLEAFIPQMSSISKIEISSLYPIFVGNCPLLDPERACSEHCNITKNIC
jgi:hypothetical protein